MLEQYTIADILTWLDDKTLVVNREFQRGSAVWPPPAQAYLIDTVLRDRPMPRIYVRTTTNPKTQRSYREVVDGQQRLRAIQAFAHDEFSLGTKKEIFGEFAGRRYSELDEETQRNFLSYLVPVEQLLNVPDSVVFDIFQRLNTYNYNLSPQELRHGKYHGAFRNQVVESSRRWESLWDEYKILSRRARVRMSDDELMAQMFGVMLKGVTDGGQPFTESLYKEFDGGLPADTASHVDLVIGYIVENLYPILDTNLAGSPHFLMLFAAVAHSLIGIPDGDMKDEMPARDPRALGDVTMALTNLGTLADVLGKDADEVPERFAAFQLASAGTTQRIRGRSVRFPKLYEALLPDEI
ncbi:MAG: DUF262 domain-containing protein [Chloroflexi bacterium]|nr:DUF262 domain-containing protein [Chloroflexota bacterium]